MKKGSIRNVTSCDFDLHKVDKPITTRDRDASHARRKMKPHRLLRTFFFRSPLLPEIITTQIAPSNLLPPETTSSSLELLPINRSTDNPLRKNPHSDPNLFFWDCFKLISFFFFFLLFVGCS